MGQWLRRVFRYNLVPCDRNQWHSGGNGRPEPLRRGLPIIWALLGLTERMHPGEIVNHRRSGGTPRRYHRVCGILAKQSRLGQTMTWHSTRVHDGGHDFRVYLSMMCCCSSTLNRQHGSGKLARPAQAATPQRTGTNPSGRLPVAAVGTSSLWLGLNLDLQIRPRRRQA